MIYLFSYQIPFFPPRNTDPLINEIKAFSGWAQCFEKTWLIATHDDITVTSQKLSKNMKDGDSWLITPIGVEYYGWLPQEIWDWINNSRNIGF